VVAYVSAAHALVHAFELTYAAVLAILIIEFESGLFLLGVLAWASAFAFGAATQPRSSPLRVDGIPSLAHLHPKDNDC